MAAQDLSELDGESLDTFIKYDGDMDAYSRSSPTVPGVDWNAIEVLLMRLFIVRAGLASAAFHADAMLSLQQVVDRAVRDRLWDIARHRVTQVYGRCEL